LVKGGFEHQAANSIRAGIAVLDGEGVVRWLNQGWARIAAKTPVVGAAHVGANLLTVAPSEVSPLSAAIVSGITAVLAGATSYVELESAADGSRPVLLAITPTRGARGAVILCAESSGSRAPAAGAPLVIDATRIAERLTTRELEVLTRVAAGLGNRAIATELGIEYTTVRGHVQSLLAKLGARSRVDAVALAYRSGLARETETSTDESGDRVEESV
jgi:DNA-binding CsgD family transcriptional regulator